MTSIIEFARRKGPKFLVLSVLVAFAGLIAHESGHALAACLFGAKVAKFILGPGIQILPSVSMVPWDGNFGSVSYSLPPGGLTNWERNAIRFMGAGTTALLALVAAVSVRRVKVEYLKTVLFAIGILWPLDILTYSIFPNIGLRHWIFLGGVRSEPYEGALGMGVPPSAYFVILGLYAIGIYAIAVRGLFPIKASPARGDRGGIRGHAQ